MFVRPAGRLHVADKLFLAVLEQRWLEGLSPPRHANSRKKMPRLAGNLIIEEKNNKLKIVRSSFKRADSGWAISSLKSEWNIGTGCNRGVMV